MNHPKQGHVTSVFVCGRDRAYPSSCSTPGCAGRVRATCDFELGGRKAGQTCDRALCYDCCRSRGGKDLCAAHAAMVSVDAEMIAPPTRPPMPCNVAARIARDRGLGIATSERALAFVRESCPCDACETGRGSR